MRRLLGMAILMMMVSSSVVMADQYDAGWGSMMSGSHIYGSDSQYKEYRVEQQRQADEYNTQRRQGW